MGSDRHFNVHDTIMELGIKNESVSFLMILCDVQSMIFLYVKFKSPRVISIPSCLVLSIYVPYTAFSTGKFAVGNHILVVAISQMEVFHSEEPLIQSIYFTFLF